MPVRVALADGIRNGLPVGQLLGRHQIIFIGQGPPYIPVGTVTGGHVADVEQILRAGHGGKSPAVIGVEQDQVGLNAQVQQCLHTPSR